ncbi:MAG: hypothetical protein K2G16_06040, partial [Lachnospiraceae bacterium]|nr:hypothetical protein [Lachnospiraceae bacterium]
MATNTAKTTATGTKILKGKPFFFCFSLFSAGIGLNTVFCIGAGACTGSSLISVFSFTASGSFSRAAP